MFGKKSVVAYRWKTVALQFKAALSLVNREAIVAKVLQDKRQAYLKERTRQKERMDSQKAHLEKLFKDNLINNDVYGRLKKLLEITYERKRDVTREKFGFKKPTEACQS